MKDINEKDYTREDQPDGSIIFRPKQPEPPEFKGFSLDGRDGTVPLELVRDGTGLTVRTADEQRLNLLFFPGNRDLGLVTVCSNVWDPRLKDVVDAAGHIKITRA